MADNRTLDRSKPKTVAASLAQLAKLKATRIERPQGFTKSTRSTRLFQTLIYWLGSKGCYAIGIVQEIFTSESICSSHQTWNMGLVMLGAAIFLGYFSLRRRS